MRPFPHAGLGVQAVCACLSAVTYAAAGAMQGALQAPDLNESSTTLVMEAWAQLARQDKMAHKVCREGT